MKDHIKTVSEITNRIEKFHSKLSTNQRYASFDFCYGYFQSHQNTLTKNMEDSCMHLWSYLASWGMLRGSSELLKKSPAVLKDLIRYIENCPKEVWEMDVKDYLLKSSLLIDTYNGIDLELKKVITHPSCTLITKIMLGVFGNIPAFDTYFTNTFRKEFKSDTDCKFRIVNEQALQAISTFYEVNKSTFNQIEIPVLDFGGNNTNLKYKQAKLIDMYGFSH